MISLQVVIVNSFVILFYLLFSILVLMFAASKGIESDMKSYFSAPHASADQDDNFDFLTYWKTHVEVYHILSRMARDVLAIPIIFVASKSSFTMGAEF